MEHQPRTAFAELGGEQLAEAAGGAGDQGHLAGEIQHRIHNNLQAV
jgi:two-component sensor histidine kinase